MLKWLSIYPILIVISGCTSDHYPIKNIAFTDKINYKNIVIVYYDKMTEKKYPNAREAILSSLTKLSKMPVKFIIMKYFIVSDNQHKIDRLSETLTKGKLKNIITQMAFWAKNDYTLKEEEIINYADSHWLKYQKDMFIDQNKVFKRNTIIFPDLSLAQHSMGIGHVMSRTYSKKGFYGGISLFVRWKKYVIPSLSLVIALKIKGLDIKKLKIYKDHKNKGYIIAMGRFRIKTDPYFLIKSLFPRKNPYKVISMKDLIDGKYRVKDKNTIVLLGDRILAPIISVKKGYKIDSNQLFLAHSQSILEAMKMADIEQTDFKLSDYKTCPPVETHGHASLQGTIYKPFIHNVL
ncbi:MAG: hypothetical protein IEMM0008_1323 [bacterium]|nr:MAG: hypothetical protein IEMM0008_1323 [bacterium]